MIRLLARLYARKLVKQRNEEWGQIEKYLSDLSDSDRYQYEQDYVRRKKSLSTAYLAWMLLFHFGYAGAWKKQAVFLFPFLLAFVGSPLQGMAPIIFLVVFGAFFWWIFSGALLYFTVDKANRNLAFRIIEEVWSRSGASVPEAATS